MSDHLVSLPVPSIRPEVRTALATLALAASFALPGAQTPEQIERDLLARFATATEIDAAAVLSYLESAGAAYSDMAALVAQFEQNPVALHTALQQHNDAGGVILIQVSNMALLTDAATGAVLHPGLVGAGWLVRSGYADEPPVGFYYDYGAVGVPQPVRILWSMVAGVGILAAIALDPPTPPLNVDALLATLQGASDALTHTNEQVAVANSALAEANQSLAAAQTAHQTLLASLGKG